MINLIQFFKNFLFTETSLVNATGNLFAIKLKNLSILHKLEKTMIDGKVAVLLLTATNLAQSCLVHGCKPTQMNKIDVFYDLTFSNPMSRYLRNSLYLIIFCEIKMFLRQKISNSAIWAKL